MAPGTKIGVIVVGLGALYLLATGKLTRFIKLATQAMPNPMAPAKNPRTSPAPGANVAPPVQQAPQAKTPAGM